jgi:hypothetical protein
VSLDDLSSRYCGVWLNINHENHLAASFGDGKGQGSAGYRRSREGTTALSLDTWYHVAAVVRGETDMSVYVNGVEDGGPYSGSGGSLAYANGNASIGTCHYANIYFSGDIDDVRLYERALSSEEIQRLYQAGSNGQSLALPSMAAINNIERAIRQNVEQWSRIHDTLRNQRDAYDALGQMLNSGNHAGISYDSIITARQQLSTAMQHGWQSREALEKSIKNLESALAALGFELVPRASDWLEQAKRTAP